QKAAVEKILDRVEAATPAMRVARMRPALIFKRDSASEQQRYFLGPLFPNLLARPGWVPFVPSNERLRFQAVHSRDVGAAFHLATMHPEARGAFNLAADPVLDGERLARILRTRELHVPPRLMRVLASIAWHLRLEPASPGWLDLAFNVPLMDSRRARTELGWHPRRSAELTILEVMRGLADHAGLAGSPPLAAR
ncbi:MAG TPA: hypothetical protein VEB21_05470, partial [Terriglobales bacterium]|nr:hypothetical protein [Terriglobales bacterium]